MPLFIVQHQHQPEKCPASTPHMAEMFLNHISREHAWGQGVNIQAEAVINGGHTLYLIADAPDRETVTAYMEPFAQVGSVDIYPASSCESVVKRGVC